MAEYQGTDETLSWTVGGMDCAGCVAKIRGAVEGLDGVGDVRVSLMSQTLSATVSPAAAPGVERTVAALGYTIAPRAAGPAAMEEPPHWAKSPKARLVFLTGGLLAAAFLVGTFASHDIGYLAYVAACLIGLAPVARNAFEAVRHGQPFTIEALMTIAAAGALAIGAAEEAAVVVFLFAVGELLEGVAAGRARAGLRALGALVPKTALVEVDGTVREVPAATLSVGEVVLVRPGERVPSDGEVVEGLSGVDESPVTGESVPRTRGVGDPVFAGSINTEAALRVAITRPPEDNTIARIIRLVEEAEASRAPIARFIDRFSRVYMPFIVVLAALVAVVPPLAVGAAWDTWIYRALALLLIGCPCALVISVPAAIASALSAGSRAGILLKGGNVVEAAATVDMVAFDKTGTLTRGKPEITDVVPMGAAPERVLAVAAAVEGGSTHPLAEAVLARAATDGITTPAATAQKALPGRGVEALVDGARAVVASPRHAAASGVLEMDASARVAALEDEGKTVVAVFDEGGLLGLLALRDEPRADAAAGLAALERLGVKALMLTGDNRRAANAIAGSLGIEARAGLMPEEKAAALGELAARQRVMMVGDGINDAPALAAAQVGVAMGAGTDVALETADAGLLRNRVGDVAALIRLSRAAMANIRQNVAIALGLKGVFLVTSILGITGLWIAILADTGATVLVTLNALRLLTFDPAGKSETAPPPAAEAQHLSAAPAE